MLITACATQPEFKPTKPVEKASTLADGVSICMEYRIVKEGNATQRDLIPWMRCIETLIRSKNEAQEAEAVVLFHKEISSLVFASKNMDVEVFDTNSMNESTQLVLKKLKTPNVSYSVEEAIKVEKYYPKFIEYVRSLP